MGHVCRPRAAAHLPAARPPQRLGWTLLPWKRTGQNAWLGVARRALGVVVAHGRPHVPIMCPSRAATWTLCSSASIASGCASRHLRRALSPSHRQMSSKIILAFSVCCSRAAWSRSPRSKMCVRNGAERMEARRRAHTVEEHGRRVRVARPLERIRPRPHAGREELVARLHGGKGHR